MRRRRRRVVPTSTSAGPCLRSQRCPAASRRCISAVASLSTRCADRPRWGRAVAADAQDVAKPQFAQAVPQFGIGAVDLVTGRPSRLVPAFTTRVSILAASFGLWLTLHRRARSPRARLSGSSTQPFGRYSSPVDQRVSSRRRLRQIHCHLGVFDPARGTGVLALHADGAIHLSSRRRSRRRPNRFVVAAMIDHIGSQIVAYFVGVPLRPPKQTLQPILAGVAAAFGQCPAVLAAQIRKQAQHQRARVPQRLTPGNRGAIRSSTSSSPHATNRRLRYEPR